MTSIFSEFLHLYVPVIFLFIIMAEISKVSPVCLLSVYSFFDMPNDRFVYF